MRLSAYLGKTLRQPPANAHLPSHELLVRAAFVRELDGALFAYLPLGSLALGRLQRLARRELLALGGQELHLPIAEDREGVGPLVRFVSREVDSYRQLPVLVYEMKTRSALEPRSRTGLFGAGQRPSAEGHLFGDEQIEDAGRQVMEALGRILASCQVPVVWAEAGDHGQFAFFSHPAGDQDLVHCPSCRYAAERSQATAHWGDSPHEAELPLEEVSTPGCGTIAALAAYLNIPASKTLKMVFYSVQGRVTCVVIRGDRAVDEAKLVRLLGTDQYYASLETELARIGAVGGYASPIGLDQAHVRVVADLSARSGKNYVSGANRPDFHIRNVNVPRDFVPGEWVDLALVELGDPCPRCSTALEIEPAFALAHKGTAVPCKPAAEYLDRTGRSRPLWMVSWHLDLGRLLAAIVEANCDDYGIVWPPICAPGDVHLVALDLRVEEVAAQAEALYEQLTADGFTVLYDDRDGSAGVKFNDADLIGIPLRLTVSKRSVRDGLIEAKWRNSAERLKLDQNALALELVRLPRT
jgi:prolyl-tRNA synthetase